jgi:AcrR family transcriptional regulator
LDATIHILRERGGHALTLDAVAKQAEVSKGGLLHHFATKEALVLAVVRHLYGLFERQVRAHYDSDPQPVGRWLRAYVRASFDPFPVSLQALTGLFPYVNEYALLQETTQEDLDRWEARLASDGVSPVRAAIIRMACDAHWMEEAVRASSSVNAELVRDALLAMTHDGGAA